MQFLLGHINSWENTSCHLTGFLKVCLKKRFCLFQMDPVSCKNNMILFGVVFRTILRIKDSIFFIFPSTTGDRVGELDWDTAGLSVCLLVLIALTSCRHLLRAQPAICKIYLVVFFHWAWGSSASTVDYELFPKQHFSMSKGWKLADVPALDLLEMLDGKINNVMFFFQ